MPNGSAAQVVLIAAGSEFRPQARIWGTGGWQPPTEREALDWLTLLRLCGWEVQVYAADEDLGLLRPTAALRWIIVACEPEGLREDSVRALRRLVESEPVVLVARVAAQGSALGVLSGVVRTGTAQYAEGADWIGPGTASAWSFRNPVPIAASVAASDVEVWARAPNGTDLMFGRRVGQGTVVTLAMHPSEARDCCGNATRLLRYALTHGARAAVAWWDWSDTMVLRMDDPGGSQNVFCRSWCYPALSAGAWRRIGQDLHRRKARLSVAYVSGWVDDGDASRGELLVGGVAPRRDPGAVYPSSRVRYRDLAGHRPGACSDYAAQHAAIRALRAAGIVEVELHGYTHMHPDHASWARATDRYENVAWFRELGENASAAIAAAGAQQHPLTLGVRALEAQFGVRPTTLVCPGDQWTNPVLEHALGLDLALVSSYYLALRDRDRFCWSTHVCAPYLDRPAAAWFDAELPVVGYFHDYEPAVEGSDWLNRCLDAWRDAGARRWIDFRELAAALNESLHLCAVAGTLRLELRSVATPLWRRPLPVAIHCPDGQLPSMLRVQQVQGVQALPVERRDAREGQILLPSPVIT